MRRQLPLLIALLLCASAPLHDFYNDDWPARVVALGRAPGSEPHPLKLYEFMASGPQVRGYIHEGMLPWWSDPQLKLRLFRPLSSLLLWVDLRVLASPVLGDLHSLLWFVLFLVVARRVIDRLLPPRAARWALWTLCLAGYHAGTVLWISARNGLGAATIALVALKTHVDDRLDDKPVRALRVAALFALALLFAETALGLVPMLLAVEAFAVRKPLADRARAVAPMLLLAVVYLIAYSRLGYGVVGVGGYVDPMREPLAFLRELPARWMTLVAEALVGLPSELTVVVPGLIKVTGALGALALALVSYALDRTRGDRPHRYVEALAAGSLFALVPAVGGILGGRLLALAGIGAALAMGALADAALQRKKRWLLAPLAVVMVLGVAEQTIEVRPVRGELLSSCFAQIYRRSTLPLREGERVDAGDAQLVMRDVVDGRPRRIEATFARPFAGRSTCLLRWRGGRLEPFDPPPIGGSMLLRHEPGPLGL